MKKLFVLEYHEVYAGGTIVAICRPEELSELIESRNPNLEIVTDKEQINNYDCILTLRNFLANSKNLSVNRDAFEDYVKGELNGIILDRVLTTLEKKGMDYPGYANGMVHPDWVLNAAGITAKEGLYIVYERDVSDDEPTQVVSHTYHDG